ncbi:hypothetical protein RUM44_010991 [Polyplax serrata]|uniref:LisH domain-containing protein n=1 Tax=Polyplax serrata TaxID=468196 RepID=A0ABR1AQH7_POLSC
MSEQAVPLKNLTDVGQILRRWEDEHNESEYDPIPILTRLAEIVEAEIEAYMKMDPDPFDERHPSRADPNCNLGHVLKVIFKKDAFMNKLVNDYLRDNYWSRLGNTDKDDRQLNIAACRLVLDVMPGLETSAVFQTPDTDALILRLFNWAEKAIEPLQSYAVGLLAAAMEVQDTAAAFREQNAHLVPIMLKRLHRLQEKAALERQQQAAMSTSRPFAHLNHENVPAKKRPSSRSNSTGGSPHMTSPPLMSPPPTDLQAHDKTPVKINGVVNKSKKDLTNGEVGDKMDVDLSTPQKIYSNPRQTTPSGSVITSAASECSNSSWAEMESFVIANVSIHPLTLATRQMLTLRYLTPMGEYQEFLSHIFEHNALSLILKYTNIRETKETRLGFESLKYLAALLCHKKVSIEFINMGGLKSLLEVPRPSVAATGVSICLYYISYCEDAMERVCLLPQYVVSDLVSYALWLLERSHNSGRCHATMFFGLSFQFRVVLEEFDAQDGLRKLYNVISTLPILSVEDEVSSVLNEDEECSYRQIVRHVTVALKKYYEAHLYIKAEQLRRAQDRDSGEKNFRSLLPSYKACRGTPEEVQAQIETLLELMPFNAPWPCVDELLRLGGITLLLQIIAFIYDWNFSGRVETVHSALNVLAICAVRPKVQLVFCDRLELPDDAMTIGMNIILGASEGEIVADPDVQKSALQVIINCVCAPIHRVGVCLGRYSANGSAIKKKTCRSSEELIQKMWESVRENNGIIVLLMLMMIKTPITDADSIRALACRALAGLARCEKVRQIVSKLPVLSNGSMQVLLRDPILQEKRQEHVQFQKYYLELIEHITGKNQPTASDDISLPNIHRANVVAQTRIQYNKNQLYQLMYEQLMQDGLQEAASALQKEANISPPPKQQLALHHKSSPVTIRVHISLHTFSIHASTPGNSVASTPTTSTSTNCYTTYSASNTSPHIKLNLANSRKEKMSPSVPPSYGMNRSLQKQTSWDSSQLATMVTPTLHVKPPQTITNSYSHNDRITLDSIVTEYLTNQHALCKNPMVTCPQFNLFVPHRCPDPKSRNSTPNNLTMRYIRRQTGFKVSNKMDNRLGHSRFCPVRTFRLNDEGGFFTCCEFLPCGRLIAMGTYQGEVWLYNLHTGAEEISEQCHDSYLYNIQTNRKGDLMLTSSTWRWPLSALWGISSVFVMKQALQEEEYAEFSKVNQDRIVGTKASTATIYDVETGTSILTLSPRLSNTYSKNRATYNPTDELILTDGVLFDVNSGKEIHKFDKLNPLLSGVFHPNGLEIVSNTEIWDLRTFHLLRTVAALDHQHVLFSTPESALYTYSFEQENDEDTTFESSFKTLDSSDYSSIATIEVKKNVYHMACNKWDTQIAVVENVGEFHTVQESSVRLYDVGRIRDTEDDAEEEEEDDDMDGSEEGSNSQSGSDNDDNTENDNNGGDNGDEGNLEDLLNEDGDNNEDDDPEFVLLNSEDSSSEASDDDSFFGDL